MIKAPAKSSTAPVGKRPVRPRSNGRHRAGGRRPGHPARRDLPGRTARPRRRRAQ